jgi:hypothetical protein
MMMIMTTTLNCTGSFVYLQFLQAAVLEHFNENEHHIQLPKSVSSFHMKQTVHLYQSRVVYRVQKRVAGWKGNGYSY